MNNSLPSNEALVAPGRPWYLTGIWPLVLGIPALTVVAGLTTFWLANHRPDPLIESPLRPDIAAMHADPAPDAAATRAGMRGSLAITGGRLRIDLGTGSITAPATVDVVIAHAAKETYDQKATVELTSPGVYEAAAPVLGDGPWYVEVAPRDRSWRLTGTLPTGAGQSLLQPYTAP